MRRKIAIPVLALALLMIGCTKRVSRQDLEERVKFKGMASMWYMGTKDDLHQFHYLRWMAPDKRYALPKAEWTIDIPMGYTKESSKWQRVGHRTTSDGIGPLLSG